MKKIVSFPWCFLHFSRWFHQIFACVSIIFQSFFMVFLSFSTFYHWLSPCFTMFSKFFHHFPNFLFFLLPLPPLPPLPPSRPVPSRRSAAGNTRFPEPVSKTTRSSCFGTPSCKTSLVKWSIYEPFMKWVIDHLWMIYGWFNHSDSLLTIINHNGYLSINEMGDLWW